MVLGSCHYRGHNVRRVVVRAISTINLLWFPPLKSGFVGWVMIQVLDFFLKFFSPSSYFQLCHSFCCYQLRFIQRVTYCSSYWILLPPIFFFFFFYWDRWVNSRDRHVLLFSIGTSSLSVLMYHQKGIILAM